MTDGRTFSPQIDPRRLLVENETIDCNHAVNLARIQDIRRRKGREDWEVKLEPPVNRALPISRGQIGKLFKAFRGRPVSDATISAKG